MSYAIVTDTAANLKREHIDRYEITVIPLSYYIEDEEHVCTDPDAFNGPAFYHALAGGAPGAPAGKWFHFFDGICTCYKYKCPRLRNFE